MFNTLLKGVSVVVVEGLKNITSLTASHLDWELEPATFQEACLAVIAGFDASNSR